jgi:hypothetical protein
MQKSTTLLVSVLLILGLGCNTKSPQAAASGDTQPQSTQAPESKPTSSPATTPQPPTALAAPGSQTYTLSSNEYTYIGPGHPVDCANGCKDLFYSNRALASPAGTTITSVEEIDRRPKDKTNHWYRCQDQVPCGVAEFSDLNDHAASCVGHPACMVWRATNGRTGREEDDIRISWR